MIIHEQISGTSMHQDFRMSTESCLSDENEEDLAGTAKKQQQEEDASTSMILGTGGGARSRTRRSMVRADNSAATSTTTSSTATTQEGGGMNEDDEKQHADTPPPNNEEIMFNETTSPRSRKLAMNRRSAKLRRDKKRNYLKKLEEEVQSLMDANEKFLSENNNLQKEITQARNKLRAANINIPEILQPSHHNNAYVLDAGKDAVITGSTTSSSTGAGRKENNSKITPSTSTPNSTSDAPPGNDGGFHPFFLSSPPGTSSLLQMAPPAASVDVQFHGYSVPSTRRFLTIAEGGKGGGLGPRKSATPTGAAPPLPAGNTNNAATTTTSSSSNITSSCGSTASGTIAQHQHPPEQQQTIYLPPAGRSAPHQYQQRNLPSAGASPSLFMAPMPNVPTTGAGHAGRGQFATTSNTSMTLPAQVVLAPTGQHQQYSYTGGSMIMRQQTAGAPAIGEDSSSAPAASGFMVYPPRQATRRMLNTATATPGGGVYYHHAAPSSILSSAAGPRPCDPPPPPQQHQQVLPFLGVASVASAPINTSPWMIQNPMLGDIATRPDLLDHPAPQYSSSALMSAARTVTGRDEDATSGGSRQGRPNKH